MATALLIVHGLVAVVLLGAISHQALAVWVPAHGRPGSFFGRFRAVPCASYANAIVVLYAVSALLGGIVYLYFRIDVRPSLERAGHWQALGFFELKEHFVVVGLALLPGYWVCWRRPLADEPAATRAVVTAILAFIVCWGFLTGHVLNNIMGFGSRHPRTHSAGSRLPSARRLRCFTWLCSSWISRCSPSIPRLASSFWARTMREMSSILRWGSLLPRFTGTAGQPRLRSERSCSALLLRCCPNDGHEGCGRGGCGWFPRSRCSRAFTSHCHGFDFSQALYDEAKKQCWTVISVKNRCV
jgi:hypothetical protein